MYNTYMLNFDPLMTDPTPNRLIEFVRSNATTYQFYMPFPGTLIIKSSNMIRELLTSYQAFIQPNIFMLHQLTPTQINGLLDQSKWDWLNSVFPPPLLTTN
jgi:hypothetical protein